MEQYDPQDEEHVVAATPVASSTVAVGTLEAGKALLGKLFGTFQRTLAVDQVAATKWYRVAVANLHYQPALLQCDQLSFVLALMQCAELGLMPGPTTGHAYLVPFQDNRQKLRRVTLIPGYKGLVTCAYRSGEIAAITCDVVHQGDEFRYQRGSNPYIHHVPGADGVLTHAYACVHLRDSPIPVFRVIDQKEAMATKARSASGKHNKGPWMTDEEAMWMKTAFRRLVPWIPMSYELRRIMEIESRSEDTEEVKRAALSSQDFLGGAPAATVSASTSTQEAPPRPSAPRRKTTAAGPSTTQAAPPSLPAPEPPGPFDGPLAPQREPVPARMREPGEDEGEQAQEDQGERERLVSSIVDLAQVLEQHNVKSNLPANMESLDLPTLTRLHQRMSAKWEGFRTS